MNEADIAARLTEALVAHVAQKAGANASLVSVTMEVLAPGVIASIEARIERRTRTLAFAAAEARDENGVRIASASSVHALHEA